MHISGLSKQNKKNCIFTKRKKENSFPLFIALFCARCGRLSIDLAASSQVPARRLRTPEETAASGFALNSKKFAEKLLKFIYIFWSPELPNVVRPSSNWTSLLNAPCLLTRSVWGCFKTNVSSSRPRWRVFSGLEFQLLQLSSISIEPLSWMLKSFFLHTVARKTGAS